MAIIIKTIFLDAEPRKVWDFVTNSDNFPRYVSGYADGKVLSENKMGVGAKYEWYGKMGPFKLKSVEEIIRWQNNSHVAYRGKLLGIKFDSSMAVKKERKNRTNLAVSIRYKVPLLLGGKMMDLLIVRRIVKKYVIGSLYQIQSHFKAKGNKI